MADNEPLERGMNLRLTAKQHEWLKREADRNGAGISAAARDMILRGLADAQAEDSADLDYADELERRAQEIRRGVQRRNGL